MTTVTQPEALIHQQIEAAAKKLAECMDYPWEHMPEQGRANMRKQALSIIEAALTSHAGADGWVKVSTEPPPCDGETMFIGENDAGYIACFNSLTDDGYCFHESAESSICVMSGLRHWKRVDLPAPPAPEALEVKP